MNHELKLHTQFFPAMLAGDKNFELRENDRNFQVDDVLYLREFIPCQICGGSGRQWDNGDKIECCEKPHGDYTGRTQLARVKFVLVGPMAGLDRGFCIISIALC